MTSTLARNWTRLCFDQVAEIVTGSTPSTSRRDFYGGPVPFVTPADLDQGVPIERAKSSLSLLGAQQARLVPKGSVLVCCIGATIGKVGIAGTDVSTNQQINSLVFDPSKVCSRYGYYYCQTLKKFIRQNGTSTTLPILNKGRFSKIEIPLPPLSEQNRIADILDKADAIRRKRQQVLDLIPTSYKSLFLSMFGDPVENHRGLRIKTIADLATRISKGESPKWQGFDYQDDGVQFITSENVRWGNLDTSTPKYISHAFHTKLERSQLAKDDLLINLVGASVGRAAIVPEIELPANVNQAVAVVSLDRKQMLPSFLLHQLLNDSVQRVLLGNVVESARANISLANIRDTTVLVPDMKEQLAWDKVVRGTAKLTDSSMRAWKECNDLFSSLVQRAFKGEL